MNRKKLGMAVLAAVLAQGTGSAAVAQPADVVARIPKAVKPRPDAIAVIIGNRDYSNRDVPPVEFAVRDARAVRQYAEVALGVRPENIIYAENATQSVFRRIFGAEGTEGGQLADYVKPGRSDVFVFYSGHGAPALKGGKAYLVPADGDPTYITATGYPVEALYEGLSRIGAKSVLVAMDACFSGSSASGGMLIKNASPAMLKVSDPIFKIPNGIVLSASAADQISSWETQRRHGLFTYYLLAALSGEADADADKKVTLSEVETYLAENVEYAARRQGRKQNIQLRGKADATAPIVELSAGFATGTPLDKPGEVGAAPAPAPVSAMPAAAPVAVAPVAVAPVAAAPAAVVPTAAPTAATGSGFAVVNVTAAMSAATSFAEIVQRRDRTTLLSLMLAGQSKDPPKFAEWVKRNEPKAQVESAVPAPAGGIEATIRLEWRGDFGVTKQKTLRMMLAADGGGKLVAVRLNEMP
ncbi:MAG: caspase domain-containing protein [Gemmatimonadota bacterium]